MNGNQSRKPSLVYMAGVLAILASFTLGSYKGQAAPTPCTNPCTCAPIFQWNLAVGNTQFGVYDPIMNTPATQALAAPNTPSPCAGNVVTNGTVTVNKFSVVNGVQTCNLGGIVSVWEVTTGGQVPFTDVAVANTICH